MGNNENGSKLIKLTTTKLAARAKLDQNSISIFWPANANVPGGGRAGGGGGSDGGKSSSQRYISVWLVEFQQPGELRAAIGQCGQPDGLIGQVRYAKRAKI